MTLTADALVVAPNQESKVDTAWRAEFKRRIADIQSGRVEMLDADAVYDELLAELAEMDRNQ